MGSLYRERPVQSFSTRGSPRTVLRGVRAVKDWIRSNLLDPACVQVSGQPKQEEPRARPVPWSYDCVLAVHRVRANAPFEESLYYPESLTAADMLQHLEKVETHLEAQKEGEYVVMVRIFVDHLD